MVRRAAWALHLFFGLSGILILAQGNTAQEPRPSLNLDVFSVRNIGPANMGGRIVDVAVVDSDPATMYVAAATGGLWKTTDAGNSWTSLMDDWTTSMGAVAVAPSQPNIVWVGSGEANPRNSVTFGNGVYSSSDGGKTWQHRGLTDTQHIGRVVIHPTNPQVVYVAALGHIWGPNPERGIFKTGDGGKTWRHVLNLGPDTGCVDLAIDPSEPDILYACAYAVRRDGFSGGNPEKQFGPAAGLYQTRDGGDSWQRLTEGLPQGPFGRCGVAVYRKNPSVVYAVVQTAKTPQGNAGQAANKKDAPEAGGIFRSDDRGKTWAHVNSLCPRPFYYGQIRIDPSDDQNIYVLGVAFSVSKDGGKTFANAAKGAHPDHHALWINPTNSKHLVLGNDGGIYVSKTQGTTFDALRGMPLGQFYAIGVDLRRPYWVYGGLQDNGSWGGPTATDNDLGITLADWKRINGSDGFHCQVDPSDPYTVYCESQYGGLRRVNVKSLAGKGGAKSIKPGGAKGGPAYRFNWSSPVLISPHDPKTIYFGGNFLFKSTNRGDKWETLGTDLTWGKPGQTSTGHTLTTIAESPLMAGLIWVGADDGRLQVSRDDGKTWIDLSDRLPGVPKNRWITRVICSQHAEGTAFVTVDRHRNDDRRPYVFKTTDFGQTWTSLVSNLPGGDPVHVIQESSRNKNLLLVGTETGVFVSLDGGGYWQRFGKGLPPVPVHDLVIHPRERELTIATHGRSIYVADLAPLEEWGANVLANRLHLFSLRPSAAYSPRKADAATAKGYVAANPLVGATIYYHLQQALPAPAVITIRDSKDNVIATIPGAQQPGLHRVFWNLCRGAEPALVAPGEYWTWLQVGDQSTKVKLDVEKAE